MSRAAPADHDERLDPVRWQRPARGTVLRLLSVAVLLVTAAAVLWLQPATCTTAPARMGSATPGPSGAGSREAPPQASAAPSTVRPIPPGSVGVPVRLADPTALTVVRPGNRVDLLRLDDDKDRTTSIASAALVLEVTGADDPVTGGLLLALTPEAAERAVATSGRGFAIVIRPS